MTCWKAPTSKDAFTLSWISVLITAVAVIVGCVLYSVTGSALCLVFGLENLVDLLSSVVVVWRFYVPKNLTDELEEMLKHREERASLGISIIMIFLGIAMFAAAIERFTRGQEDPEDLGAIVFISGLATVVFGMLTVFKFHYSKQLESPSLYKDALCSLIGTSTSAALFANALIIVEQSHLWWIDPLVSALGGVLSFAFGGWSVLLAIFVQKANLCSIQYWSGDKEYDTSDPSIQVTDNKGKDVGAVGEPSVPSPTKDLELTENKDAVMT